MDANKYGTLPLTAKYVAALEAEIERLTGRQTRLLENVARTAAEGLIPARWDMEDMAKNGAEIDAYRRAKADAESASKMKDATDATVTMIAAWHLIESTRGTSLATREAFDEVGKLINRFLLGQLV